MNKQRGEESHGQHEQGFNKHEDQHPVCLALRPAVARAGCACRWGSVALADGPQSLSIPPGSATVYVTTRAGTVDAVTRPSHTLFQLLRGGAFGTMDYDALSDEVYVPDAQRNVVDVLALVDAGMNVLPTEPEHVFHLPASPQAVAITNDGQLGFVAMRGGSVAMLDLLGRQVVYTAFLGGTPILSSLASIHRPPFRSPLLRQHRRSGNNRSLIGSCC
ncbi:MAG TPA: hypothetical protein VKB35_11225 [Ktedonobacteraceae bacterium]|nr:hypothetical protein [Ktedonobacteraceae bacterium]